MHGLCGFRGATKEKQDPITAGAWLFGLLLMLALAGPPAKAMTYGRVTYSDMSVGSDGTTYGWGVTDANSGGCYCHTAKVSTTIRSPNGRTRTASDLYGSRGHEYARADVYLPFEEEGDYTESSTHWAFCPYCACYYVNAAGSSKTLDFGHSVNWLKFDQYDEIGDKCVYIQIAGCSPTCTADVDYWPPPCSDGTDNKAYMEVWRPYWRWKGSGTRHCLPKPIGWEVSFNKSPGTCPDVD
jgi:hypothetical protein